MAKLVCHGEKYKKGAISKIERHNERLNEHYSNQDIDLEKSYLNYSLIESEQKRYFPVVMELVDGRNNPTGKKTSIQSMEQIVSGKTMFGNKITIDEKDYKTLRSLA